MMGKFYAAIAYSMVKGMFGSTVLEYVHSNKDGKKTLETLEYNDYIFDLSMADGGELPETASIDINENSWHVDHLPDEQLKVTFNAKVSLFPERWSLGYFTVIYPKSIADHVRKTCRIDPENPQTFAEYRLVISGEQTMTILRGKEWVEHMKDALLQDDEIPTENLPFCLYTSDKYTGIVEGRYFNEFEIAHWRDIYKKQLAHHSYDFSECFEVYGSYSRKSSVAVNQYTTTYENMIRNGMERHEVLRTVTDHIQHIKNSFPDGKNREEYVNILNKYIDYINHYY